MTMVNELWIFLGGGGGGAKKKFGKRNIYALFGERNQTQI